MQGLGAGSVCGSDWWDQGAGAVYGGIDGAGSIHGDLLESGRVWQDWGLGFVVGIGETRGYSLAPQPSLVNVHPHLLHLPHTRTYLLGSQ